MEVKVEIKEEMIKCRLLAPAAHRTLAECTKCQYYDGTKEIQQATTTSAGFAGIICKLPTIMLVEKLVTVQPAPKLAEGVN